MRGDVAAFGRIGLRWLGLNGGNGRAASADAKLCRRTFPVCLDLSSKAGRFAYVLVLLCKLSAGTDYHEYHSTYQKSQHAKHENNAPGKARADPGHS